MSNLKICTAVLGLSLLAMSCDQPIEGTDAGTDEDGGSNGSSVVVTYAAVKHPVSLSGLAIVDFKGAPHIKLSTVILAALNGPAIVDLKLDDMLADDGFSAASKAYCQTVLPVVGATIEQGYLEPAARAVKWEAALQYPGCMEPDSLREIKVSDQ